jgi:UDP-3-O-[3-hydroxymyristoyl] glucosamine N-acyltransferase
MKLTAQDIANIINGTVEGNPVIEVNKLSKIESGQTGSISFLANPKYTHYIYETNASIVIVDKNFQPERSISATLIRVESPYEAFAKMLEAYNQMVQNKKGVSTLASIADSSTYGSDCYIGEFTSIGENVIIGNNVKIYPGCYIGDNVSIVMERHCMQGLKLILVLQLDQIVQFMLV